MLPSLLLLLLVLILPSCASMDQSIGKMKDYLPDISMDDFITGEEISKKKESLSKLTPSLKKTNLVFSPIISLEDFNKEGVKKNKFFLVGEIYSKKPETQISSLSSDNCYFPGQQATAHKLERMYHVFIKDLGLNSTGVSDLDSNEKMGPHFLIQPVLLKYQYCKKAEVEIRYLIQGESGTLTTRTIKTSHRAKNFKLPEKDETHPFINYKDPGLQFPGLRHALTMAFYKNTLDLIRIMSKEYKGDETK